MDQTSESDAFAGQGEPGPATDPAGSVGGGEARIRFVTGSGGAGRTTVAASLARVAASGGARTVLLTTAADQVAGLGPLGFEVREIDAASDFTDRIMAWQERGRELLDQLGAQPLESDELTQLPGSEPFALFQALREAVADYQVVVVDLPPASEAVRTLLLPGQLERYLSRLLPPERQAARALRPVLAQLAGVPMPSRWMYESGARLREECAKLTELVQGPGSDAVLVLEAGTDATPGVAETRAGFALARVPLAAVVANRVLPANSTDPWLAELADSRREATERLRKSLDALPLLELPHLGRQPRVAADLDALGLMPPWAAPPTPPDVVEDRLAEDGELVWWLTLPGAVKERLALVRRGDEAIVSVGPYRRALPLPAGLRRCTVTGARLLDGVLAVRFAPDPKLWPRSR